jgi:hypothetical protein
VEGVIRIGKIDQGLDDFGGEVLVVLPQVQHTNDFAL